MGKMAQNADEGLRNTEADRGTGGSANPQGCTRKHTCNDNSTSKEDQGNSDSKRNDESLAIEAITLTICAHAEFQGGSSCS